MRFDPTNGRSLFTTPALTDIQDENLQLFDGYVAIEDLTPPTSSITSPVSGFIALADSLVISGTAQDAGVGLKSVEVSVDSGQTWRAANNTGAQFETWQYTWKALSPGNYYLMSRAEDLNENLESCSAVVAGRINAPPNAFDLLQPQNGETINTLNPILVWQAAIDNDPGDQVSYQVVLSAQSDFADTIAHNGGEDISATQLTICCNLAPSQTYFWKVIAKDTPGDTTESERFSFATSPTATDIEESHAAPEQFALLQNYPNPFNPSTVIRFHLPVPGEVRLTIHNVIGHVVRTLVVGKMAAGTHSAVWDGRDAAGNSVASGLYFYRLRAGDFVRVRKMLLVQ